MKPRRIFSALLLSLGLILLTFAATCRLIMTRPALQPSPSPSLASRMNTPWPLMPIESPAKKQYEMKGST